MKPIKTTYKNLRRYIGREIYIEPDLDKYNQPGQIGILTNVEIAYDNMHTKLIIIQINNDFPYNCWFIEENDTDLIVWSHPQKVAAIKLETL